MSKDMKTHYSQISIFFIIIIATLIAVTFITVNIGKIALDKTYSGNSTDAGALSAASAMAYGFNYVANANAGDGDKTFKKNWDKIKETYTNHFNWARGIKTKYDNYSTIAQEQSCVDVCGEGCPSVSGTAAQQAKKAANAATKYAEQMDELIKNGFKDVDENYTESKGDGVLPSAAQLQQAFLEAVRKRMHDDQDQQNDIYQNALYLGYIYGFNNSGASHRMGKINQKLYSAFLEDIKPETVQNGEMLTFSWIDGAGRAHSVSVTICIEAARTYKLKTTEKNRKDIQQLLTDARQAARDAAVDATSAEGNYSSASGSCGCSPCAPPCGLGTAPLDCKTAHDTPGDSDMKKADIHMKDAADKAKQAEDGLNNDGEKTADNKDDSEDVIIKYITDIEHDRLVESLSSQSHMGSPIKGMRGDIDIMTAYPPVLSDSTASFAGNGDIENGKASHDASLVSAF